MTSVHITFSDRVKYNQECQFLEYRQTNVIFWCCFITTASLMLSRICYWGKYLYLLSIFILKLLFIKVFWMWTAYKLLCCIKGSQLKLHVIFIVTKFYFLEDWRCMINTCYLWRKVAYTLGLRDLKHCKKYPDTDNNCLCRCGQSLNRKIRCRKNFRNGKYKKGWFSNFLNWIRIHITICILGALPKNIIHFFGYSPTKCTISVLDTVFLFNCAW